MKIHRDFINYIEDTTTFLLDVPTSVCIDLRVNVFVCARMFLCVCVCTFVCGRARAFVRKYRHDHTQKLRSRSALLYVEVIESYFANITSVSNCYLEN